MHLSIFYNTQIYDSIENGFFISINDQPQMLLLI